MSSIKVGEQIRKKDSMNENQLKKQKAENTGTPDGGINRHRL